MPVEFLFDMKIEGKKNEWEDILSHKTRNKTNSICTAQLKYLYIISETMINLMAY